MSLANFKPARKSIKQGTRPTLPTFFDGLKRLDESTLCCEFRTKLKDCKSGRGGTSPLRRISGILLKSVNLAKFKQARKSIKQGSRPTLPTFIRWFEEARRIDAMLRVSEETERLYVGSGWNFALTKNPGNDVELGQPGQLQTGPKVYKTGKSANFANFLRWFKETRRIDVMLRVSEETLRLYFRSWWNFALTKNQGNTVEVGQPGRLQTGPKVYKTGKSANFANFFRWFKETRRIDVMLRVLEETERLYVRSWWNLRPHEESGEYR